MKNLAVLVIAGIMALFLSGCGQDQTKETEVKTETVKTQPGTPPAGTETGTGTETPPQQ